MFVTAAGSWAKVSNRTVGANPFPERALRHSWSYDGFLIRNLIDQSPLSHHSKPGEVTGERDAIVCRTDLCSYQIMARSSLHPPTTADRCNRYQMKRANCAFNGVRFAGERSMAVNTRTGHLVAPLLLHEPRRPSAAHSQNRCRTSFRGSYPAVLLTDDSISDFISSLKLWDDLFIHALFVSRDHSAYTNMYR